MLLREKENFLRAWFCDWEQAGVGGLTSLNSWASAPLGNPSRDL